MNKVDSICAELVKDMNDINGEAYDACRKGYIACEREMKDELERERMRLAGCGVAAMQNTPESAKDRITPDSPYYSASYGDVCNAVDREMKLQSRLAKLEVEAQDRVDPKWLAKSAMLEVNLKQAVNLLRSVKEMTLELDTKSRIEAGLEALERKDGENE